MTEPYAIFIERAVKEYRLTYELSNSNLVKMRACLIENMMTRHECQELLRRPVPDILEALEDQWERLEAMRDSIADANEPLIDLMQQADMPDDLIRLFREGRTDVGISNAMLREVTAGRFEPAQWPDSVRNAIDLAAHLRADEHTAGLHAHYVR